MAKNFDVKQFLLQKGERVGLGVAGAVALLMIVSGAWSGIASDNPDQTASDIKDKAAKIQNTLASGEPISDRALDPLVVEPLDNRPVELKKYASVTPNFIETGLENSKRQKPTIYGPEEFDLQEFRAQVMSYIVTIKDDRTRVGVLVPKEVKDKGAHDAANYAQKRWGDKARAQAIAYMRMGVPANQLMEIMKRLEQQSRPAGTAEFKVGPDFTLDFADAGKIPQGGRLAETVQPYRMVIVSAAFPYHAQLKEYNRALGIKGGMRELLTTREDMPRFLKFEVQRRTMRPDGKPLEGWKVLELDKDYGPVLNLATGTHPDPDALQRWVIFPGLVVPRPKLARGEYPRLNLPLIDKTIKEMEKTAQGGEVRMVASPLERQFRGDGVDIFGNGPAAIDEPKGPKGQPPLKKGPMGGGGDDKGGPDDKQAEPVVPEHCLVRFIDVKVEPGKSYQYQIRIRVQNPNYKREADVAYPDLAKEKELASDWSPREEHLKTVKVSPELYYYATDPETVAKEKNEGRPRGAMLWSPERDAVYLQAHKWLERVRLNPENNATTLPVGDWTIADIPARRGEFIRRTENVELPIWFPTREGFDFAVALQAPPKVGIGVRPPPPVKGIPVDFVTEDLLIDWEGGNIKQKFQITEKTSKDVNENAPVESLVMSADGTLRVLNSRTDMKDPERVARYTGWRKFLQETRDKGKAKTDKPVDQFKK